MINPLALFSKSSLSVKILSTIYAATFVILLFFTLVVFISIKDSFLDAEEEKARLIVETAAPQIAIYHFLDMKDELNLALAQLKEKPDILEVSLVITTEGTAPKTTVFSDLGSHANRDDFITARTPIVEPVTKEAVGFLQIVYSNRHLKNVTKKYGQFLFVFALILFAVSFVLLRLVKYFLKPLQTISQTINNYKLGHRIDLCMLPSTRDEIGNIAICICELSQKIEDYTKRLHEEAERNRENERLLAHQSRLASMGEMMGNIAHQWRQPLNTLGLILNDIDLSYRFGKLDAESLEAKLSRANEIIQYMSQTIDDFRYFFSKDRAKEDFCISRSIERVKSLLSATLEHHNIRCEVDLREDIKIHGGFNEFNQVLLNIINNAKDSILSGHVQDGRIVISAWREKENCFVSIKDNGPGVLQQIADKIFDPYFTTKHKSQGTGLGLYMSKVIIERKMGGKLFLKKEEGGANFMILLPCVRKHLS